MGSLSEEELFALSIQKSPAERAAFLDRVCQDDPSLRAQVESLVAAYEQPDSLLERGVCDATLDVAPAHLPITEKPGTQIGPYKLLQQVGEGGMGVVYMAEQKEPVKRRVALKIIKPGMDTRQVIARFEAERQALAMMDHPNIAKVLDAGATESGRPYFVMELVNGLPVTKYCDEQHLTPKERLELFVPICQAVQHAHQKGIIHRDLKPSNILVALYDGRPVPKVIDFGVAKATSQTLTEKTMFTQLGQVVGTLEYMSPEQAERNQLDIDTRSDIYSLGVVLYELLTGDTPFDRTRLRAAAFDEMLRIIREEEPSKPSTKVSSSLSLPSIAANRRIEPAKLGSMIRGELDWIVLKAMEKDRGRRYETASKFAEDVQHYLNDEAVVACPPSATYKFRKFARRNKGRLITSSILAAALLVAVGGVGWGVRDRVAREQEITREKEAREQEIAHEKETQQARTASQTELILQEVERLARDQKWSDALAAAERAEAVLASNENNSELKPRVSQAIGNLTLVSQLDEARMVSAQIRESGFDYAGADRAYRQAFAEASLPIEQLTTEQAAARIGKSSYMVTPLAESLLDWALSKRKAQDDHEWEPSELHLPAVADAIDPDPWRRRFRASRQKKGTRGKAFQELAASGSVQQLPPSTLVNFAIELRDEVSFDSAAKFLRQSQDQHPNDFWLSFNLAICLKGLQPPRLEEAAAFYRVALAIRPESAAVRNNLGGVLKDLGNLDEAIACYRRAIELDPKLAITHSNLGLALTNQGKLDEAIAYYHTAIELDPKSAIAHGNLGIALVDQGKLDEAIACHRRAIELDPKFANAHYNLGICLKKQGKLDEAIDCYLMAIELDPKNTIANNNLGTARADQGKLDEAIAYFRTAIELEPKNANAHYNLGGGLHNQGKLDEAIACYRTAIDLDPKFANAHYNLGICLKKQGKLDEAIACFRTAIDIDPKLTMAHSNLASLLERLDRFSEAESLLNQYFETLERTFGADDPRTVSARKKLAPFFSNRCWHLATAADVNKRNPVEAVRMGKIACELRPDSANNWNNLGVAQYRAGDFTAAVEALLKADVMTEGGDRQHRMFLAMSLWQLDRQEDALKRYAEGAAWIAAHNKKGEQLRFRAEAEELLGLDAKRRDKLIEEYYSDPSPENATAGYWQVRGRWHYDKKEFEKSVDDYTQAIRLIPQGDYSSFCVAYANALIASGQLEQYRAYCTKLVGQFGDTEDSKLAMRIILCLNKAPDAVEDWTVPMRLAERVLASENPRKIPVALFFVRAGQYQRSIELQTTAVQEANRDLNASDCLRLALGHHGLEDVEQARDFMTQAEKLAAENTAPTEDPNYLRLHREVSELLASKTTSPKQKENPVTQNVPSKENPGM